MDANRKIVLVCGLALPALWIGLHAQAMDAAQDGWVRAILGSVLALAVLVRPKRRAEPEPAARPALLAAVGIVGAVLGIVGIVAPVRQFEWIGMLLLVFACLRWALPPRYARDTAIACFVFYWVHPLPGQLANPLQFQMQEWSVLGAEWLLHAFNQPAWADGILLQTGQDVFEVPAACSGMATSVTVLLCTLGTVTLLRFPWYESLGFVVLGLVQVLALNILRIAHMVWSAPGMDQAWAADFLHDTLGIYLLLSLFLIQAEISFRHMTHRRRARHQDNVRSGVEERGDQGTMLPGFWRAIARWAVVALVLSGLAAGSAFAVWKRRPLHRANMIERTVPGLMRQDAATAERAALAVLAIEPGNVDMQETRARALVAREKFHEAIEVLDRLALAGWTPEQQVLKAWALYRLGDSRATLDFLDSLDPSVGRSPGVALIKAEIAAEEGRPADAAALVVRAARAPVLAARIHALYPFLATHEQWQAISDSDVRPGEYAAFLEALAGAHAHLRMNRIDRAEITVRAAVAAWPAESRLLEPIVAIASATSVEEWPRLFAAVLTRSLDRMSTDDLSDAIEPCFQLGRPDLAWRVLRRLHALDPDDPSLVLAPLEFGDGWLVADRAYLGLAGARARETVDLALLARTLPHLPGLEGLWRRVPLLDAVARRGAPAERAARIREGLEAIARRRATGEESLRLRLLVPSLLVQRGDFQAAHAELDAIQADHPAQRRAVALRHAELYTAQGAWEHVYEAVRRYYAEGGMPSVSANLRSIDALVRLGAGPGAIILASQSRRLFPYSPQVSSAVVGLWDVFGQKEEALHLLRGTGIEYDRRLHARLLHDTGRFQQARQLADTVGFALPAPNPALQGVVPPPAELTVQPGFGAELTSEEIRQTIESLAQRVADGPSAFFAGLHTRAIALLRGEPGADDLAAWETAGRDDGERALALQELGIWLARQGKTDAAAAALSRAVVFEPEAFPAWRALVAVTGGDLENVRAARRAVPTDPEIWLAESVGLADTLDEEALRRRLQALRPESFSPGTFVRAGDFYLRRGLLKPAAECARLAHVHADGLISAYMLGLRCAAMTRDLATAMHCARQGVRYAQDPWPFHMAIVDLRRADGKLDADLIKALEFLRRRFERDPRWTEVLGEVYFRKGDLARALTVLSPLVQQEYRALGPQPFLLAAEAARRQGRGREALGMLLRAYERHPGDLAIVNNLAYNLAANEATAPRAMELYRTRLADAETNRYEIADTAALIHLRLKRLPEARTFVEEALRLAPPGHPSAVETTLNLAELEFAEGELDRSLATVERVRRQRDATPVVHERTVTLAQRIQTAIRARDAAAKAAAAEEATGEAPPP